MKFFFSILVIAATLQYSSTPVRAGSILGTTFDYQFTSCPFSNDIKFVRIGGSWMDRNPSPGVYLDNTYGCTTQIVALAVAQGKTIMFDFDNAPAWVLRDPAHFTQYIADYADHEAKWLAKVAPNGKFIFGVDNEFWITITMNPNATPDQLAAFYYNFALWIAYKVMPVFPTAEINIVKSAGFNQGWDICRALQKTNIGQIAGWATFHTCAEWQDPLARQAFFTGNSQFGMTFEQSVAQLRAWFPMCKVGSDEAYCDAASLGKFAVAIERAKPDMMIHALICDINGGTNGYGFTVDTWGVQTNGVYKQWALDFAEITGGCR